MAKDHEILEAVREHWVTKIRFIVSYENKYEFHSLREAYGAVAGFKKKAVGGEPLGFITLIMDFEGGGYVEYVQSSHDKIRSFIRLFDHNNTIPTAKADTQN